MGYMDGNKQIMNTKYSKDSELFIKKINKSLIQKYSIVGGCWVCIEISHKHKNTQQWGIYIYKCKLVMNPKILNSEAYMYL